MRQTLRLMNYFVLNKQLDYRRGVLENCCWADGRLTLLPGAGQGAFLSRIYDSQAVQNRWHRFAMEAEGTGRASLRFTFYASDSPEVFVSGKRLVLKEFLSDSSYTIREKKRLLKPLEKLQVLFPEDILLYGIEGRYLFFLAELFAQDGNSPSIFRIMLYFPREDWLRYLPGVYAREKSGADFTARFLGIFQSMYEEMDAKIRNSSRMLDILDADASDLGRIAGWFHVNNIYLWQEKQLKCLMARLQKLFAETGTVHGLLEVLALYTGEKPILIECGMVKGRQAEKLYGNHPYECILLIRESDISTVKDYEALMCLVDQMKPAHVQVRIIPLKPRIVLGSYSYLGINSYLQGVKALRLDGQSSLAFSAVGTLKGGEE